MTDSASCDPQRTRCVPGGIEPWFVYAVFGVLLVALAVLMGVSLRLYRQAHRDRAQLAAVEGELDSSRSAVAMLAGQVVSGVEPVERERLDRVSVTLDGRPVEVLVLPVRTGRSLGLREGDWVRVGPAGQ